MNSAMGRAEALAAIALVVGARQEPVAALRRLVVEDRALGVLMQVARKIESGVSLPDALVACRLIARRDAERLVGITPAILAEELTRLAQGIAAPSRGELLAQWFPVWAVLAATIPSLLIGAVVALVGGAMYGGVWQSLGLSQPTYGPGIWWFVQVVEVLVAVLVIAGCWWGLQQIPVIRLITIFSHRLNRAIAADDLVRLCRSGADATAALAVWTRRSGDAKAVRQAAAASGGDATTTLMRLGVVPRMPDGRPDWDAALAETTHVRSQSAQALAPWLMAVLVLAGIHGFMSWELEPLKPIFSLMHNIQDARDASVLLLKRELAVIANAGGAVVLVHLFMQFSWCDRWLRGPARDWPLVADRLARGLDRHEDPDHVLRSLRLAVGKPMRHRLDAALMSTTEIHLGSRLVHAGIAPAALSSTLLNADTIDLPALLRSSGQVHDDHGVNAATSQATALLVLSLVLTALQFYFLVGIMPKFLIVFQEIGQPNQDISILAQWSANLMIGALAITVISSVITAWGHRRGWWIAGGGWARLARGLVMRRLLATGATEAMLARSASQLIPRRAAQLTHAAQQGNLPGVLAATGWPVQTAAELDRALNTDLLHRERRRARFALIVRILLPFLIAVPIGLSAVCVFLSVSKVTQTMIGVASGHAPERPLPSGGTPALVLIHWWTLRFEEQGAAVVDEVRANRFPPKTTEPPRPVKPKHAP